MPGSWDLVVQDYLDRGTSCTGLHRSVDQLCRFDRVWESVEKVYQGLVMSCSGFPGSVDQVCQVRGSGLPGSEDQLCKFVRVWGFSCAGLTGSGDLGVQRRLA